MACAVRTAPIRAGLGGEVKETHCDWLRVCAAPPCGSAEHRNRGWLQPAKSFAA